MPNPTVRFGVCAGPDKAALVKDAGWEYVEFNCQTGLQGLLPDDQWTGGEALKACGLPTPACNVMVPGDLKVCGPTADLGKLTEYMTRVLSRAPKVGCDTIVFGSGVARKVPDGFDREQARQQILAFLRMIGPIAQQHGVTVVIEPLNQGECNIINSVGEGMTYVREVNHPNVKQLLDTYHFWLESEPLQNLRDAGRAIRHVHLADKIGRTGPGMSGQSDYRAVFRILKDLNYQGNISVEASKFDIATDGKSVLKYVKEQWAAA
jgi:sugar phosphate isomerase/epimerase